MRVKIYMPWQNVGCLGLRVGRYYMDFYSRRVWGGRLRWIPGIFISTPTRKMWIYPFGTKVTF